MDTKQDILLVPTVAFEIVQTIILLAQIYEGSFRATEGPASNKYATDIFLAESNTKTPEGNSLQLKGTGFVYGDFRWTSAIYSPGKKNHKQIFDTPLPVVPFNKIYLLFLFIALLAAITYRFFK